MLGDCPQSLSPVHQDISERPNEHAELTIKRLQVAKLAIMRKIEESFGVAVRRWRQKLDLSQEDFADQAGIHRTYVSSIELGKVQVSIGIAQKLADTLGVPLSKIWKEIERERESGD